jgi:hypothetical protein
VAEAVSGDERDLKLYLEARSSPSRIILVYGDQNEVEKEHAIRLSGLPCIALHPLPVGGDDILREMAKRDDFRDVLIDLLDLRGLSEEAGRPA